MKLIFKSTKKIVVEIQMSEIKRNGFDFIWDKIRTKYNVNSYDIFNIEKDKEENFVFVELTRNDF